MAGKVGLVTGATRGIGRAVAEMLLKEGANVAICGRRQDLVDQAVAEMNAVSHSSGYLNKVVGQAADVRKDEDVAALFRFVDHSFGGTDVLVNNAGVGVFKPVGEISIDDWKLVLETNLNGAFYCTREALFRFATRGGGYVVNISSLAGKNPFAGGSAYNASKFGLNGFSEAAMLDARNDNVRVSYVMPGSVATEFGMTAERGSEWKIWPEDIAEIVRMLLLTPARTLISRVEVRPSRPKSK